MSQNDSIVITGCGWVTPFASGSIQAVLQAAARRTVAPAMPQGYWLIPDELLDGFPNLSPECRNDPGAWLTAVAFELARRGSSFVPGSVPSERVGLVLGNALAGQSGMIDFANDVRQQSPRFVSPIRFPQTVGNFITGALSRAYDIRGPNSTIACGSASGLSAVIDGCALLSAGKADVIFAGGTERLTPALASGLADAGVIFSDGACLFVLERREHALERSATVLATINPPLGQCPPEPRAEHSPGAPGARATPSTLDPIRSVAGSREPNAVFIEHWIGRCLGALGAAAVAAAIGAAQGLPVPFVSEADSTVVITRTFTDKLRSNGHVVVRASSDGGPPMTIEIVVPPSSAC